jgi:hypothetical protein
MCLCVASFTTRFNASVYSSAQYTQLINVGTIVIASLMVLWILWYTLHITTVHTRTLAERHGTRLLSDATALTAETSVVAREDACS